MRFGPNVVEHAPFSIPMIGNTATGYVIGLTPEGAAVCHRMFTEDVPEAEIAAVNADLPIHLRRGGFVVEGESADGVALREGAEGTDEGALGKGVEDAARPEGAEREENVGVPERREAPQPRAPTWPRSTRPCRCSRRTCTSPTIAT